jgi:hypothetical protein
MIYGVLLIVMMMLVPSGVTDPKLLRKLKFRENRRLREAAAKAAAETGATPAAIEPLEVGTDRATIGTAP